MDDARALFEPHLFHDESLLWWGRPDPTKHFGPNDRFWVPFSAVWGGFAIFWGVGVVASEAPRAFVLFGLVFVAAGLYMIFGRFIVKSRRKRHTVYGLTDQRALVFSSGSLSETRVSHPPIERSVSRDGRHMTVVFAVPALFPQAGMQYANTGLEYFWTYWGLPFGFYDVADVAGLGGALRRGRR
jgi:hypothetical protein